MMTVTMRTPDACPDWSLESSRIRFPETNYGRQLMTWPPSRRIAEFYSERATRRWPPCFSRTRRWPASTFTSFRLGPRKCSWTGRKAWSSSAWVSFSEKAVDNLLHSELKDRPLSFSASLYISCHPWYPVVFVRDGAINISRSWQKFVGADPALFLQGMQTNLG
eukprot:4670091-Amphidinium_carterae.1